MAKRIEKPMGFKPELTSEQKQMLFLSPLKSLSLAVILRHLNLEEKYFDATETHYWFLYLLLTNFLKQYNRIPDSQELRLESARLLNDPSISLEDDIINDLVDLIEASESMSEEDTLREDVFRKYLSDFLEHKLWQTLQAVGRGGRMPDDLNRMLRDIQSQAQIVNSITAKPIESSFPAGYEKNQMSLVPIPFGVPFMDTYLGGGGVANEVYILLGPYGSCKTTLMQQMSVNLAVRQKYTWEYNKKGSLGFVYFVTYELQKEIIRLRSLAHLAQIPFKVLQNRLPLSSRGMLNERDTQLYQEQLKHGLIIQCESERKYHAEKTLDLNWRILDFSGLDEDDPLAGGGLCREVGMRIQADLKLKRDKGIQCHCSAVFIDYVRAMVSRYCTLNNKDLSSEIRHLCLDAPSQAHLWIGNPLRCPVWLAQQLSASGNELSPGIIADQTMAAESRGIAENCDFSVIVSRTTHGTNLGRLGFQKTRRMEGLPPTIIQVSGPFSTVTDVSSMWAWEPVTKQFVRSDTADTDAYREQSDASDEDTADPRLRRRRKNNLIFTIQ